MTSVASLPAEAVVQWNVLLGPRLSTFENNVLINLCLTPDYDYLFTNGAMLEKWVPLSISQDTASTQVFVDQRTPLSIVVAAFVEKHFPNEVRPPLVHQGRPESLGDEYYVEETHRINLNLTAWHHQLSDGDILAFQKDDHYIVD